MWLAAATFGVLTKPEIWWLCDYKIIIKLPLHFLFILPSVPLSLSPFCFVFHKPPEKSVWIYLFYTFKFKIWPLSQWFPVYSSTKLFCFWCDVISSCLSQDTQEGLCFQRCVMFFWKSKHAFVMCLGEQRIIWIEGAWGNKISPSAPTSLIFQMVGFWHFNSRTENGSFKNITPKY